MRWLLALLLCACDPPPLEMKDYPCPSSGTPDTYASFGMQFLDVNCNICHAAPDGQRHGAPDSFTFVTLDDVHQHADRIFVRAAGPNTSMPPGPNDPPADERQRLADWLTCGAP